MVGAIRALTALKTVGGGELCVGGAGVVGRAGLAKIITAAATTTKANGMENMITWLDIKFINIE